MHPPTTKHTAATGAAPPTQTQDALATFEEVFPHKDKILAESDRWKSWGTFLFESVKVKDKGAVLYRRLERAREQLERIVRHAYPNVKVFVFGSGVVHQIWDGESDIDFTCIDCEAWGSAKWPPDERIAVLKCTTTLGLVVRAANIFAITGARVPILKYSRRGEPTNIAAEGKEEQQLRTVCVTVAPVSGGHRGQHGGKKSINTDAVEAAAKASLARTPPRAITWSADNTVMSLEMESIADMVDATIVLRQTRFLADGVLSRTRTASASSVPDVRCVDFDLSFRSFGLRNSYLLQRYMSAHVCVRPGALFLKAWSKGVGLNDSSSGWLCTYAINVLWLHFLMKRDIVPFVPPLSVPREPSRLPTCPSYSPLDLSPDQCTQLGRLIVDFFFYYAKEFDWENEVVTINRAEVTPKSKLGWGEGGGQATGVRKFNYVMCIEDPYEENFNLGRFMTRQKLQFAQLTFVETALTLLNEEPNSDVLRAGGAAWRRKGRRQNIPGTTTARTPPPKPQLSAPAPAAEMVPATTTAATTQQQNDQLQLAKKILSDAIPDETISLDIRRAVTALRQGGIDDPALLTPNGFKKLLPAIGFWVMDGRVFYNNKHTETMIKEREARVTTTTPAAAAAVAAQPAPATSPMNSATAVGGAGHGVPPHAIPLAVGTTPQVFLRRFLRRK
eukprot:PhM_4_TR4380/c0_g1_i1/m.86776/K14079/PAPD4, GLD2; poly(A) RNA polymerase GLD2